MIFLAILGLRMIVGLHFFSEGISKVRSGSFDCASFLSQAKGPLAPYFLGLLDDHDGTKRLSVVSTPSDEAFERLDDPFGLEARKRFQIDPAVTFSIWDEYLKAAKDRFKWDQETINSAEKMLNQAKDEMRYFLDTNEDEILAYVSGLQRLQGFERDGALQKQVADDVESLSDQIATIKYQRESKKRPWLSEIEAIWDHVETSVNRISNVDNDLDMFLLERPYALAWSPHDMINRFLPWFDLLVGVLLVLGLLTRIAALAGVGLLMGVVMTQPFWVPGVENTYYQWIEIGALLVLFAAAGGRFGGLDYFFMKPDHSENSV